MIRNVLALLQTLFDIMRLRKGPDSIPWSPVVLVVVVLLWIVGDLLSVVASPDIAMDRRVVGWLVSLVGLAIYASVANFYRRRERLLQMITAIIGCGAVFGLILTIVVGIGSRLSGDNPMQLFFVLSVFTVMLWSVVVDGHILSRTIDQPRIIGVMIALSVFLLQLYLIEAVFPATSVPTNSG